MQPACQRRHPAARTSQPFKEKQASATFRGAEIHLYALCGVRERYPQHRIIQVTIGHKNVWTAVNKGDGKSISYDTGISFSRLAPPRSIQNPSKKYMNHFILSPNVTTYQIIKFELMIIVFDLTTMFYGLFQECANSLHVFNWIHNSEISVKRNSRIELTRNKGQAIP